ncbi:hypothetical protein ISN45_Aa05g023070 [Arabidopsis thaliana x Arabidopsis arenosa]|uniref:DUF7903 domain-containing protein n=1 Tax=Arabidopsis thaliana x Arabidopsis arenosa TaxID=1240361 RepID=A0A8T1ZP32_9BRAS|nr:hypothetical protein ISN45_Aa05g023070 [Arabidopsis thaliana x Arabidopsis arenosa]
MSYVPPHKRHENVGLIASSVPPSLLTKLNKNLGSTNTKIIYANDFIYRWFLVGSESEDKNFQLVPVSLKWRNDAEEKSLGILAKSDFGKQETPWLWVTEKVEDDLIKGFDRAKKTLLRYGGSEDVKLRLIARFGKVVFHGVSSSDTLRDDPLTKSTLEKLKKTFRTNVPKSYVENVRYGVVHKMGFCVEETKELYHVKVADNTRPSIQADQQHKRLNYGADNNTDATISCKCMVDQQHKRLNFYKAELSALRHLNLDVSCLDQDLDMRLMVDSKRTLTNLSENEIKNLKELTDSAVIDPTVKGGLKWPLGKSSCADRYRVCGVWHTINTTYRNQALRLQILEADRYDFRTGIGGTSSVVNLKLKALSTILLKEENVERKCVSDMLKDVTRVLLRATANVVGISKLRRPIGAIHHQFSTASSSSSSFSVKPNGGIGEGANLISGRQLRPILLLDSSAINGGEKREILKPVKAAAAEGGDTAVAEGGDQRRREKRSVSSLLGVESFDSVDLNSFISQGS